MEQRQLRSPDVYGRTFQMDEATLGVMATRLERRGQHPFFQRCIAEYVAELALPVGASVLDIGCGTGVAARSIARWPGFQGRIVAIDISEHLVEAGRRLSAEEGIGDRIEFHMGDAHGLRLAQSSFDAVVMHTLISHVAAPAEVLAEAKRLLRQGGRLVVFDGDYSSLTFATDADDGGAATDGLVQRTLVANPRVMRAMPRLLAEGGFDLIWSRGYLMADIGRLDFWTAGIASFRALLPKAGAMAEAEANAFVERLERSSAENRAFAASNFYTYLARH